MLFSHICTDKQRVEFLKYFTEDKKFNTYVSKDTRVQISVPYLADVMAEVLYPNYRFCTDTNVWYSYNGQLFTENDAVADVVQSSFNQFKTIIENTYEDMKKRVDATTLNISGLHRLHSSGVLESVMTRLRSKTNLQVKLDMFDIHNHLLTTPNGIINLITGKPIVNSALNLCKMITSVGPLDDENGAKCPNYMSHLKFMANEDPEVLEYLEQLSGYILTGDTGQQKFYWWYGLKNNGKSTLARLWLYILNDYACTGSSGQFAKRYHEPHSEEDMRLRDKRFIHIDELVGNQFNQEKIKRWTDGGEVTAAEKGGKTTRFCPKGKIFFTSNNKPTIDGADGGFERRLDLTPFMNQVPLEVRKLNYDVAVLRSEAPYILNRMIKQAKRYYETQTIIRPIKTSEESAAYMQQNDIVGEFVNHGFIVDTDASETAKRIFEACQVFCQENNYEMISPHKLGKELARLGFKMHRDSKIRSWVGLRLNKHFTDALRTGYG